MMFALLSLVISQCLAENTTNIVGHVDQILGHKDSIEVKGSQGNRTLIRGSEILPGDTIATDSEAVRMKIQGGNELNVAPHTILTFEEVNDGAEKRDVILLQEGLLWGLIINEYSLNNPYYIRTSKTALAIPTANFVVEYKDSTGLTSVVTIEGNVKIARSMTEFSSVTNSKFVPAGYRIHIPTDKMNPPKLYKHSLLIRYLNLKAKELAKDMANRGTRALSAIKKTAASSVSENDITWNIPLAPTPAKAEAGKGPPIAPHSPPSSQNPASGIVRHGDLTPSTASTASYLQTTTTPATSNTPATAPPSVDLNTLSGGK